MKLGEEVGELHAEMLGALGAKLGHLEARNRRPELSPQKCLAPLYPDRHFAATRSREPPGAWLRAKLLAHLAVYQVVRVIAAARARPGPM